MERTNRAIGVCWRFLNGHCYYGDRCRYRHEGRTPVCWHFQKGACWFGDNCKFRHVSLPERSAPQPSAPLQHCHFSAAPGQSDRGVPVATAEVLQHQSRGWNSTVNQTTGHLGMETAGGHSKETQLTTTTEESKVGEHLQDNARNEEAEGATAAPQSLEIAQAIERSKDLICGICMDNIFEKPTVGKNKFGILPNCTHSFCIDCIQRWRKTRDVSPVVVKTCPLCRIKSGFFVPHTYWVEGQEKEDLIDAFKKKFSDRTCGYFRRQGCCPFKSDCLYRHDRTLRRPMPEDTETFTSDMINLLISLSFADSEDEDVADSYDDEELNLYNTLSSLGFFD